MRPRSVRHLLVDRDGVLDEEPSEGWLDDPAAWRWIPGSRDALVRASAAGVRVSVVTNQSGIGRGEVAASAVAALHRWLEADLRSAGVDLVGIFVCPHAPLDGCPCRKPRPGLVRGALAAASTSPGEAVLVGDAARDLDAASAAGVHPVLVRTGHGAETASRRSGVEVYDDLASAVAAWWGNDESARARST